MLPLISLQQAAKGGINSSICLRSKCHLQNYYWKLARQRGYKAPICLKLKFKALKKWTLIPKARTVHISYGILNDTVSNLQNIESNGKMISQE
jgi:hypothetical protein